MIHVGDVYSLNTITENDMDSKTMVKVTKLEKLTEGWLMGLEMVSENPHGIADYWISYDQQIRLGT